MTKREIRIAILGELALQPKQIVWDIGAGTGSVSIEIARLCPNSQVYAIEKTAIGQTLIEQNCQRLQVNNVIIIRGKAPEILSQLPAPDRIFIGGSGGNLAEILEICQKKINPEGLLVIALATLENLYQSLDWFSQNSWQYRLLQLQISRSTPVGSLTRFTPLNPVSHQSPVINYQLIPKLTDRFGDEIEKLIGLNDD
jgi:precorrin-6Y C5,15-methyltransferase (decarboxylating)